MADEKKNVDGRDDSRVAGEQSYELSYLQEKLGASREEIKKAIEKVGNDREKVEEYLKKSTDKN